MPDVIHSQLGMFAQSRRAGGTMRPRSAPGPGAGRTESAHQPVCLAKASARHPLLDDGRDERLHHEPAAGHLANPP